MNERTETLLRCGRCALLWAWLVVPAVATPQIRIEAGPEPTSQSAELTEQVQQTLARHPELATLDVRVTIGAAALRQALRRDDGRPVIAAYLTSTDFHAAVGAAGHPPNVTAIFANPDPRDQLTLARVLLGEHAVIGVFDSPVADSLLRSPSRGTLQALSVRRGDNINAILRQAHSLDALLVLPDGVLTRDNIHHVVRTLYGHRVVLIGYSAVLTRVGSLASVYAPSESIAAGVRDILSRYAATQELAPPMFVDDIDVAVNARLARSLNLALPPTAVLVRSVREGRRRP